MKILIISRGYPTKKYPMNGIFEFDQAKAIAKSGHEVIYASIDMRSIRRRRKWGIEKFKKDGVLIYGINYPLGRIPRNILTYFSVNALERLYKKIEKESGKPDIMHAHFTGMGYAGARLKKITGIPLVITEHSSGMMSEKIDSKLIEKGKLAYPHADRIITVSPALSEVVKNVFKADNIYIPNMLDTDSFKFENKEKNKDNKFVFITVGGLIYRKRMDLTVEAFVETFKDNKNVDLIIIGEGSERPKIKNLVEKYNMQDRIKLTGSLERKDISKYMNVSNCFVLPSMAETFGVVYIEAMITGLPVIATRCGGPEGFVNESNGILIDVDNKEQLVSAMKYMYENSNKYDSNKIVEDTHKQFSPEAVAGKIIGIYDEILKNQIDIDIT